MALCAIGVIGTLVLAVNGDLTLYIHPRYVVFTVLLSILGAALFGTAVWYAAAPDGAHDHGHAHDGAAEHDSRSPETRRGGRALALGVAGVVLISAVAVLVVPPTTLSPDRAASSVSSDGAAGGEIPPTVLIGSDPSRYSVRDWAAILASGATANDLVGQRADVTGVLLVDDRTGVVRVGRYAVTCCTVDAQLFAVRLASNALEEGVTSGQWVRVVGTFADEEATTLLSPVTIEAVEEPDDPYLS
jgi:uncharacterized repeat protein (TIGR03943 family)